MLVTDGIVEDLHTSNCSMCRLHIFQLAAAFILFYYENRTSCTHRLSTNWISPAFRLLRLRAGFKVTDKHRHRNLFRTMI